MNKFILLYYLDGNEVLVNVDEISRIDQNKKNNASYVKTLPLGTIEVQETPSEILKLINEKDNC